MAQRSGNIDKVLCQLPTRVELASDVLKRLCHATRLSSLLPQNRSWAIFGGAVRDLILAAEKPRPLLLPTWPDLDIALSRPTERLLDALTSGKDYPVKVARNSYGGLKIFESRFGVIDVWTWRCADEAGDMVDFWREQLEAVDFGLNAVAFIWPECEILLHPRWQTDLEACRVERLASVSPRRELQPVRAIALADKLGTCLGCRFSLGTAIKAELQWLLSQQDDSIAQDSLDYLKGKIDSGRWRETVLNTLSDRLGKRKRRLTFGQLFDRHFEVRRKQRCESVSPSDAVQMLLFSLDANETRW